MRIVGLQGILSPNLVFGPLCRDLFILNPKSHDIITPAVTICVASWCLDESLQESRNEVMGPVLVYIKGSKEGILFQSKQGKENVASDLMLHLTCGLQTVREAALNFSKPLPIHMIHSQIF